MAFDREAQPDAVAGRQLDALRRFAQIEGHGHGIHEPFERVMRDRDRRARSIDAQDETGRCVVMRAGRKNECSHEKTRTRNQRFLFRDFVVS
jgi:hypothetical protein